MKYNLKNIKKKFFLFPIFLIIQTLPNLVNAASIESKTGKKFENIIITENTNTTIEFIDQDGIISKINKSAIKNIVNENPSDKQEIPQIIPPKNTPEFSVLLNQSFANDGAFQGSSLFGERQSRRNNQKYKEFNQAWNLATSIELLGLPKNLQIGLTILNPLVDRTNVDSDNFYQTAPGGVNQNSKVFSSIASGSYQYDPNSIKLRNEKNEKNFTNNEYARQYLIEKYQHQRILNGIFFFNLGYTARF